MGQLRENEEWFACPTCGSEVQVGSRGCSTCAQYSDLEWQEGDPDLGLADIPVGYSEDGDDDFDYEEFVATEFGGKPRNRLNPVWIAIALSLFLILLFLLLALPRGL